MIIVPASEDATGADTPEDALPQTISHLISSSSSDSSPSSSSSSPSLSATSSGRLPYVDNINEPHPWASPGTTGDVQNITGYLLTWLRSNPQTFSNLFVPLLHEILGTTELQEQRRAWRGIVGTDWENWVNGYRPILRGQQWGFQFLPYRGYIQARDQERLLNMNSQLELNIATWVTQFITENLAPNAAPPQPNPSPTSAPTIEQYMPQIRANIERLSGEIQTARQSRNMSELRRLMTEQALLRRIIESPNGEEARRYMTENPISHTAVSTSSPPSEQVADEQTVDCPICRGSMDLSLGEGFPLPQCGHNIHIECLREHLLWQNGRNVRLSCPTCRANISGRWARNNLGIDVPDRPRGAYLPDDNDEEEKRVDSDGQEYTRQEFINHYGLRRGQMEWDEAGRLMAEGERSPPRRPGTGGGKKGKSKRSKSKRSKSKRSKSKTKKKSKRSKSKTKKKKKSKRSKSKRNKTKTKFKRSKSKWRV
jgi:hypothetical protein